MEKIIIPAADGTQKELEFSMEEFGYGLGRMSKVAINDKPIHKIKPAPLTEREKASKAAIENWEKHYYEKNIEPKLATKTDILGTVKKHGIKVRAVNPWFQEVELAGLLNFIESELRIYLVLPEHAAAVISVWTLLTWGFEHFDFSPRLCIVSAAHQCGKTTLLEMLNLLTRDAKMASNISASALFRTVSAVPTTILIDEGDTFIPGNEEIRCILDAGFKRTGNITKSEKSEDNWKATDYKVYSPVAIACIGLRTIPATVLDRGIVIKMSRKTMTDKLPRFRVREQEPIYNRLIRKFRRYMDDNARELSKIHLDMPEVLTGRAADSWEPLQVLANAASPEWGKKIHDACIALSQINNDGEDFKMLLLNDMREIFIKNDVDFLLSKDLISELVQMEERKWSMFGARERPITPYHLASMLKDFDIRPRNKHLSDDRVWKGYFLEDCKLVFDKYLPPLNSGTETSNNSDVADTPSSSEA
jgi:hypothetical protein